MEFYIGSYTSLGGPGIAVCSLKDGQGQMHEAIALPNPTYLILSGRQDNLFAISSDSTDQSPGGSYAAYARSGGTLTQTGRYNTEADGPCHLCLSADERFLYTANYQSGTVSVFPLEPRGACIQLIRHAGSSVNPDRQEGPHVHHVSFIPGSHILAVVDLGLDQVVLYDQNTQSGLLKRIGHMDCPAGYGPRHIAYGQAGCAYLIHEMGNAVSLLHIDGDRMILRETWSTLPDGWLGDNTGAAIRVAGRFVFASNRGHDSLAVFMVGQDGRLELAGVYPTGGQLPRDFYVLPDFRIIVAHQGGGVTFLQWDPQEQTMRNAGDPLPIAGAVCVCPVLE